MRDEVPLGPQADRLRMLLAAHRRETEELRPGPALDQLAGAAGEALRAEYGELAAPVIEAVELLDAARRALATAEQWRRTALEDAERRSHELYEEVVQRLFATGVGLEAMLAALPDPVLADRLRRHIADLDDTLAAVRAAVFGAAPAAPRPVLQEIGVTSTVPAGDVVS